MNEIKEILSIIKPENIKYSLKQLFPDCKQNKNIVHLFGLIHIILVVIIVFGIFLKPSYLKFFIIYLCFVLLTYLIYDNQCIVTKLTDKLSNMNTYPIKISIKTAKKFIYFQLVLSILFLLVPKMSLYENLIKV